MENNLRTIFLSACGGALIAFAATMVRWETQQQPAKCDDARSNETYRQAFAEGLRHGARRVQDEAVANRAARYEGSRREWFVWNSNGHYRVRLGGPQDPWSYSHDHNISEALRQFDALQADLTKPRVGSK